MSDVRVPVTILTGYLGSGKTTLLQRLLETEGGRHCAVIINEFGEVSLDHLLVRPVSGNTVVLRNGCVCCSVRSELREGLRELLYCRDHGRVPFFDRIVIETTGLADPVPLVQTLTADPMLRHQLRLSELVATIDTINGIKQLFWQNEAVRQAATADWLILTKTDLSDCLSVSRLERRLAAINPGAVILHSPGTSDLWEALLQAPSGEDQRWLALENVAKGAITHRPGNSPPAHHGEGVHSFIYQAAEPIDWTAFAVWLSALVHRHGHNVLRVKGLIDTGGATPVLLNAVQYFIHPPVHLEQWPDDDRRSRLVFIVQDLTEAAIRASLEHLLRSTKCGGPMTSQIFPKRDEI